MIIDDIGQQLSTDICYNRIISLVPSTTETLFSLGLGDRVVGCTRFCVHPQPNIRSITKIGGTKNINIDRIQKLQPDIILANAEENTKEIFEELRKYNFPLYIAFPQKVSDALQDLLRMGNLLGVSERSTEIHSQITQAKKSLPPYPDFTFAYLIWRQPWMAITDVCFISDMITQFGGRNIFEFSKIHTRYPEISLEDLKKADVVFLSSEPYPFQKKHIEELHQSTSFPKRNFQLIDGELSSWHGSRMLQTFLQPHNFIDPDAISSLICKRRM
jgi:ABC-type Fe3+-hydroxamate transport system substrate-binding protein